MAEPKATLKQLFVYELLAFSPKYNSFIAEELYELFGEEKAEKLLKKLQKINAARAKKLAELEANDPKSYREQTEKEEAEFRKHNDAFYDYLWNEEEKDERRLKEKVDRTNKPKLAEFNAKMDVYKELIRDEADFGEKLLEQLREELKEGI